MVSRARRLSNARAWLLTGHSASVRATHSACHSQRPRHRVDCDGYPARACRPNRELEELLELGEGFWDFMRERAALIAADGVSLCVGCRCVYGCG
jgi:hypothetical protein